MSECRLLTNRPIYGPRTGQGHSQGENQSDPRGQELLYEVDQESTPEAALPIGPVPEIEVHVAKQQSPR